MKKTLGILILFMLGSFAAMATDTTQIKALLDKSKNLQRSKQEEALRLAKQAHELSLAQNYPGGIARANVLIGSILFSNGKVDTAKVLMLEALKIYSGMRNGQGASSASLLLSYIYLESGMKDSAFSSVYEALRWNQTTNDSFTTAQIYIHLGNLHLDYGDLKQAYTFYSLSAEISERNYYQENRISAWDGLGQYHLKTKDYKQGLSYFIKVDSASKVGGDDYTVAQNLTNIALCYENLKNYSSAKLYYQFAVTEYQRLNMRGDLALGYYNLGAIYWELHQADSAIIYLNQATVLARQSNDLVRLARSFRFLALIHSKQGKHEKAFIYQQNYSDLSDSILNNEKVRQIAEMQTKYDTEKKEQQIALLDAQNKTKAVQRTRLIISSILLLLLVIAVLLGLLKSRKQKKISEALLLNILPKEVADELKLKGSAEARYFDQVSVMFTDFRNFTQMAEGMKPADLVHLLHTCFMAFDAIISKYEIEKIKTIGDSYMCASGLPVANPNHAAELVKAGLEIQEYMNNLQKEWTKEGKEPIEMRIGIHSGPVVAGIVGAKKFAYDIWGDTVNIANRMENSGSSGKVNISETTYALIKDKFHCTSRGQVVVKHQRSIAMYFVDGLIST